MRLGRGPASPHDVLRVVEFGDRTIKRLLESRADEEPAAIALTVADATLTWGDLADRARQVASVMVELGVAPGDVVCQMTANSADHVAFVFAAALLGVVECPINVALQGDSLAHVLEHSEAKVLFVDPDYLGQLEAVAASLARRRIVVWGTSPIPPGPGPALLRVGDFTAASSLPDVRVRPIDASTLMYTSGTTGKAKGVLLPHHFTFATAAIKIGMWGLSADDVLLSPLPLYHSNARYSTLMTGLLVGAGVHILPRFSASRFWYDVRETGATEVGTVGTVAPILLARPASGDDRNHRIRMMHGAGAIPPERRTEFEQRFGVRLVNGFAMTETGHFATTSPDDPLRHRASGRAAPFFDVRILDEHDEEVAPGGVGEICVRPTSPYSMLLGYFRQPDASLETFRNLWFHTGDLGFIDEAGLLNWTDRKKDAIRRRGEMISSMDVENAAKQHGDVLEAAAVGVPGDLGEEEVFLYVTARPEAEFDYAALHATLAAVLPAFAVPRFIRAVDTLPRTQTHKLDKKALRVDARPSDAWEAPHRSRASVPR